MLHIYKINNTMWFSKLKYKKSLYTKGSTNKKPKTKICNFFVKTKIKNIKRFGKNENKNLKHKIFFFSNSQNPKFHNVFF